MQSGLASVPNVLYRFYCVLHRVASTALLLQLSIGCVRAKFAKHIAILILVDATASALGFYLFGFAFAYGDELTTVENQPVEGFAAGSLAGNPFIGKMYFAMDKMLPTSYQNWVFQWTVGHFLKQHIRSIM